MKRYAFAVIAVLFVFVPWRQAVRADAAHYTVENLGNIGGLVPTITGVNANGQISGYVNGANGTRAVRYTPGAGWQYLPGLDTSSSTAYGINASGALVGYHFTAAGSRAFRYSDDLGVQDIAPLPGSFSTQGYGINDAGDIVGSSGLTAFIAHAGGPAVSLGITSWFSTACGINGSGQVAGSFYDDAGLQRGFRFDPGVGVVTIVGFDPAGNTAACAIDASGRVGGQSDVSGGTRAFRFFAGTLLDVDPLHSSLSNTEAIAAGTSVGWFTTPAGSAAHAFVHTDADGPVDLNALVDAAAGWVLSSAKAVNADGVIVGEGTFNGARAVFRLTTVAAAPADTTAPVISSVTATPSTVWPPKGQTVTITVSAAATDDSGQAPVCSVSGITGPGTSPIDFNVTGANTGTVLAVGGRTYTFTETCVDGANNSASSSVAVTVPADTTAPVISAAAASPSTIWPPTGNLVPVTVSVTATDDVDDSPVCALTGITSTATTADDSSITGAFTAQLRAVGGRTYTLNVRCADVAGNQSNTAVSVVVPPDTTAPTVTAIAATPGAIWPPNGKFVPVSVSVSATDDVDASPSCSLTSITGAPASDFMITGAFTASVRASKNAEGSTRVYALQVSCADHAGNTSTATAYVQVSKDLPLKAKK